MLEVILHQHFADKEIKALKDVKWNLKVAQNHTVKLSIWSHVYLTPKSLILTIISSPPNFYPHHGMNFVWFPPIASISCEDAFQKQRNTIKISLAYYLWMYSTGRKHCAKQVWHWCPDTLSFLKIENITNKKGISKLFFFLKIQSFFNTKNEFVFISQLISFNSWFPSML